MSIPDEGVREMFKAQNIDSVLAIPIFLRGRYFGFLGFDACNGPRKWSRDDREALKSISHTVGNLIERKISEKALREERARLDNIIRGANLGTWEWNLQTNQVKYNDRWAEMIGFLPEELDLNRVSTWRERTHPADIEKSNKILRDHINGKTPFYECELRMRHKAGHWIWIRDKGKIISYTTNGKPEWMFGTHSDITEAKRTEKELLQKNIELQKRNTELDRFVYSTSHDLRSPLASLLGLIAIADSNTAIEQEEQRSIFRMMEKSVKRLDGFIGDILDYSRNSRQELKTESISFKELVEQQLDDVAHLNGTVGFEIKENVNQTSDFSQTSGELK
jgi:PAS domain S-box-containing protein